MGGAHGTPQLKTKEVTQMNKVACDKCGNASKKGARLPGGTWLCRGCAKERRKIKKAPKRNRERGTHEQVN